MSRYNNVKSDESEIGSCAEVKPNYKAQLFKKENDFHEQTNRNLEELLFGIKKLSINRHSAKIEKKRASGKYVYTKRTVLPRRWVCSQPRVTTLKIRRYRGVPKKKKSGQKYRRWKPARNAKSGNKQRKKRFLELQKIWRNEQQGNFKPKQKEESAVIVTPNVPVSAGQCWFCYRIPACPRYNHRKEYIAFEMMQNDLERLKIARQERSEAAKVRLEREKKRDELRIALKEKLEAKENARIEREGLKVQRKNERRARAVQKKHNC